MPSLNPRSIAVIDCGAGNLHSVRKALASQLTEQDTLNIVTNAADLSNATHIVLPGVGAFADCMAGLNALPGMRDALEQAVLQNETPFLGICVGMQMLFERGLEYGSHAGLGWFKGEVTALNPTDPTLRIPHMGWNQLEISVAAKAHPFFTEIPDKSFVYYVHSYAAQGANPEEVLATAHYGGDIVSVVGRKNIVATQFHPEKSQAIGLRLIRNFVSM